jgi:hypothetical protein
MVGILEEHAWKRFTLICRVKNEAGNSGSVIAMSSAFVRFS